MAAESGSYQSWEQYRGVLRAHIAAGTYPEPSSLPTALQWSRSMLNDIDATLPPLPPQIAIARNNDAVLKYRQIGQLTEFTLTTTPSGALQYRKEHLTQAFSPTPASLPEGYKRRGSISIAPTPLNDGMTLPIVADLMSDPDLYVAGLVCSTHVTVAHKTATTPSYQSFDAAMNGLSREGVVIADGIIQNPSILPQLGVTIYQADRTSSVLMSGAEPRPLVHALLQEAAEAYPHPQLVDILAEVFPRLGINQAKDRALELRIAADTPLQYACNEVGVVFEEVVVNPGQFNWKTEGDKTRLGLALINPHEPTEEQLMVIQDLTTTLEQHYGLANGAISEQLGEERSAFFSDATLARYQTIPHTLFQAE